jgi:hypothetical protein
MIASDKGMFSSPGWRDAVIRVDNVAAFEQHVILLRLRAPTRQYQQGLQQPRMNAPGSQVLSPRHCIRI